MSQVVTVLNQKGGVGKTTTSVNLAAALAEAGKRILLIDLDPQANATSGLGIDHRELEQGVYDFLLGELAPADVMQKTGHDNLWLIPSTSALAGAQIELVSALAREQILRKKLEAVREEFDFIIIDNAPSLGLVSLNGLVAADSVLIPVQAEYYALEGLGQLMETIDLVQKNLHPNLQVMGAVITMYDARTRLSQEVFQELQKHFPNRIFRSVIPRSIRLAEAPSFGKTIFQYDPYSKAAQAYQNLAMEFLEK